MQFFVSTTWLGKDRSNVLDALKLMQSLDCDGFELGSTHTPEFDLKNIKKIVEGRKIATHNFFPASKENFVINLASQNKTLRSKSLLFCKNAISIARDLGALYYTVHPGFLQAPIVTYSSSRNFDFSFSNYKQSYEKSFELMLESLQQLISISNSAGVKLLVESEGSITSPKVSLLEKPEEFRRLFDFFPNNINMNLNLPHTIFSSKVNDFELVHFYKEFIDKIQLVELSHNDGTADQHLPLVEHSNSLEHIRLFSKKTIVLEFRNTNIEEVKKSLSILKRRLV